MDGPLEKSHRYPPRSNPDDLAFVTAQTLRFVLRELLQAHPEVRDQALLTTQKWLVCLRLTQDVTDEQESNLREIMNSLFDEPNP